MPHHSSVTSGMEPNVAAALSYVLGPVTGILFLLLETHNRYVRFHAAQSLALSVVLIILNVDVSLLSRALAVIPLLGALLVFVITTGLGLATFLLWLLLIWRAYHGEEWELPLAGEIARKMV